MLLGVENDGGTKTYEILGSAKCIYIGVLGNVLGNLWLQSYIL